MLGLNTLQSRMKNKYIMYGISFFQGMVFYSPIATLYRQVHGVTIFQISIIETISLVLTLALEIPWGIMADKIGYKKTMCSCCFLFFISKIIFWRATNFASFLTERIILSIVLAGISGVDSTIIYSSDENSDFSQIYGIYNSVSMIGLLFAAIIFAVCAHKNYSLAGFLTVVSYGIAFVLSLFLKEVRQAKSHGYEVLPGIDVVKEIVSNHHLLLFLIAVALISECHQSITIFLNQPQYIRCGFPDSGIGLVFIIATILGTLGFCSSIIKNIFGTRISLLLVYVFAIIACLILAVTQSSALSVAGILTLRIVHTIFQPIQMEVQQKLIHTPNRATILSMFSMVITLVASGISLVIGAVSEWNLSAGFLLCSGICLLGWTFIFVAFSKKPLSDLT